MDHTYEPSSYELRSQAKVRKMEEDAANIRLRMDEFIRIMIKAGYSEKEAFKLAIEAFSEDFRTLKRDISGEPATVTTTSTCTISRGTAYCN